MAPDLAPILELHRSTDGYITIHRKDDEDRFVDLVAVPASEIATYFPGFLEELDRDSFYSINAYYKGTGKSALHPGLPRPFRRKSALRWLTAAFVDLDCGREGTLTVGQAYGCLVDMERAGVVPRVSMTVESGRGLWAFWFLKNDDPRYPADGPVRAWSETVSAYCAVQRAIAKRLASLEVDHGALDATRVTRIPGSINSKAGKIDNRVAYRIQYDARGRGIAYTLRDLCAHFGITARRVNPAIKSEVDPAIKQLKRSALVGRWAKALVQFETLRALRGGFREGQRYTAARLLGSILRTLGKSADEIRQCVHELGAECLTADGAAPAPLDEKDVEDAIKGSGKIPNLSGQTIADLLNITPTESARLDGWPPATKYGQHLPIRGDQDAKPSRAEQAEKRRAQIRIWVNTTGRVPSIRETQTYLADLFGVRPSTRTIGNDLEALGLARHRKPNYPPSDFEEILFDD